VKVLLDTCTFLWAVTEPGRLSQPARAAICDNQNKVFLSAASVWEISVKYGLGKLTLPKPPEDLIPQIREESGFDSLPVGEREATRVHHLPQHHRDPFDRMLIAQATEHDMTIVTSDKLIHQYDVPIIW